MGLTDSSLVKTIVKIMVVFIAAFGGIYLGMKVGGRSAVPTETPGSGSLTASSTKLTVGTIFPEVTLIDESGAPVTTSGLLAGAGGVVFFMELGCPPCVEMTGQWQEAINDGAATGIPSMGVTINLPIHLHPYRAKHGLSFPLYSDTANIFMRDYDVTSYPFMALVDKSGVVRFTTDDPRQIGDFDRLRQLIQQ